MDIMKLTDKEFDLLIRNKYTRSEIEEEEEEDLMFLLEIMKNKQEQEDLRESFFRNIMSYVNL